METVSGANEEPTLPVMQARRCRAVADFVPAPGALYELPLNRDDEVTVIPSSHAAPAGWLLVQHQDIQGLIPNSFVVEVNDAALTCNTSSAPEVGTLDAADALDSTGPRKRVATHAPSDSENKRVAMYSFKPEAGAVYELPIEKGDVIELAIVDYALPDGWVVARNFASKALGLVPSACLAALPKAANEPSVLALKETAERALREALAEKESMTSLTQTVVFHFSILRFKKPRICFFLSFSILFSIFFIS